MSCNICLGVFPTNIKHYEKQVMIGKGAYGSVILFITGMASKNPNR